MAMQRRRAADRLDEMTHWERELAEARECQFGAARSQALGDIRCLVRTYRITADELLQMTQPEPVREHGEGSEAQGGS
jgi:hypothetical protein